MKKTKQNGGLKLFESTNELANIIRQVASSMETQVKINESIQKIMDSTILCCVQKREKTLTRFFKTSKDGEDFEELCFEVDEMCQTLLMQIISVSTYTDKHNVGCGQTTIPYHSSAAAGIDHTIIEVTKLFEWNKDKPAMAVLVHGIGGSGKTKLADAVIACLNLEGFQSYSHKKYGVTS